MSLTVWLKDGHTVEVIKRTSAGFTERTGVPVELVVVPEGAAHDLLLAGERRPDVVTVPYWYLHELVARDVLRPLDDLLAEHGVGWDVFAPAATRALTVAGHRWAAPHTLTGGALSYRADLMERAGLDPPRTIDEALHAARILAGDGSIHGLVARASTEFSSIETYAGWAWARGIRLLPDTGDPDPATVEQGVADLVDVLRTTAPGDLTTREYAAVGDLVAQGRAAMMFDTSAWGFFFEDRQRSQVAGRMGYTTLAGPAANAQFLYAEGLGVTSWSRSPVEAAAFVAWRQSEAVLRAEVLDVGRVDVPRVDLRETPWYADAVRQRSLDGYMQVVRRSWDEADIAHVAQRPDFVPQARRLMTAIAAVLSGRRTGLSEAVSAAAREADHG